VLASSADDLGVTRLGFESDVVTVDQHEALVDAAGGTVLLHRTPGLVGRLRLVKDETEIAALRAACAVADSALADLIAAGGLRPGAASETSPTTWRRACERARRGRRSRRSSPQVPTPRCRTTVRRTRRCAAGTW
jgi:Xaa-Pro aminopeptidase